MGRLVIENHHLWPIVILDSEKGQFEIKGKAIPENAWELFSPILAWMDRYVKSPRERTEFVFHLEYFNTTSSKYILEICQKLEWLYLQTNTAVRIIWKYDEGDSDVEDAGMDYRNILKVPMEIQEVDLEGKLIAARLPVLPEKVSLELLNATERILAPPTSDLPKPPATVSSEEFDIVTGISDRLQKKLNQANEKLKLQSEEIKRINNSLAERNQVLQNTLDALTKAKVGKRAATIVLTLASVLFVVSEILEYIVEYYSSEVLPLYIIFLIKLGIALTFTPIESYLEGRFLESVPQSKLDELLKGSDSKA